MRQAGRYRKAGKGRKEMVTAACMACVFHLHHHQDMAVSQRREKGGQEGWEGVAQAREAVIQCAAGVNCRQNVRRVAVEGKYTVMGIGSRHLLLPVVQL